MRSVRYWIVVLMLVATAVGYQRLPHGRYVPAHRALQEFPRELAGLAADDIPISSGELSVLGEGEFIHRMYRNRSTGLPVSLYIGFYPKQETGGTVHSPQHCLPGGGWEPVTIAREKIRVTDGRVIEVNRYVVQRNSDRLMVLYWFQGRGSVTASEYWSKLYLVRDAVLLNRTDGAVVRVSAPVLGDEEETVRTLSAFVTDLFPHLGSFVPE